MNLVFCVVALVVALLIVGRVLMKRGAKKGTLGVIATGRTLADIGGAGLVYMALLTAVGLI